MIPGFIAYDCEVFAHDWLFCFKDVDTGEWAHFWNDREGLRDYVEERSGDRYFASFNGSHYDKYVLQAALCRDFDPEHVKEVNDWIIKGEMGFTCPLLKGEYFDFPDVDLMLDTQVGTSLKHIEGSLGMDIVESSVDFRHKEPLTDDERSEVLEYCRHDVEATERLLALRQDYLRTKMDLGERAGLTSDRAMAMTMTNAKLTARVLGAVAKPHDDERDYRIPDNLLTGYIPDEVLGFFARMRDGSVSDEELWSSKLELEVGGCPVTVGFGGIHGALPTYREEATAERKILNVDVSSYYPSLMVGNGYTSRNLSDPDAFESIYRERLAAKKAGDKATANSLKLILNTTYGATLNQYNPLYDPLMARSVCISGQLYLLELAEHCVADVQTLKVVQLNTDGLMVSVDAGHVEEFESIKAEWEARTGFELETDHIDLIHQRDVNTYVMVADGHVKKKGGTFVRGYPSAGAFHINNDCIVVAEAVEAALVHGIPVRETVEGCTDPAKFQMIAKAGHKYDRVFQPVTRYGGGVVEEDRQKCNRVYASRVEALGTLYKVKAENGQVAKMAGLPDHCDIQNEGIPETMDGIDVEWYVALAEKQLSVFYPAPPKGPKQRKSTKKEKKVATAAKPMNVYQKLAEARRLFGEAGVKKSGKNRHLGVMYFELSDIVPVQNRIFAQLGLLEKFTYNPGVVEFAQEADAPVTGEPYATATVINVDDPTERITFTAPWKHVADIVNKEGRVVNNAIQDFGGEQTYLRRYLKMQVLDVVESDEVDADTGQAEPKAAAESAQGSDKPKVALKPEKAVVKPKAPVSAEERKEAAKAVAAPEGKATELQKRQLKKAIKTLKDAHGEGHPEVAAYVTNLFSETEKLENLTKARCEQAIREVGSMKESFETEGK